MNEIIVARVLAWAKIWSPMVPDRDRCEAWILLGLPNVFKDVEADYWSTFHAGMPSPIVPLLIHAAVSRDGTAVREEWMLVINHLDLRWSENVLAPDHLGVACEILAVAVARDEDVLVAELCSRFLMPWCEYASQTLTGCSETIQALPELFAITLLQAVACKSTTEGLLP